jgi:hypothetical protein
MIYLIYCKNFCKCHNVPPPSTTIKNVWTSEERVMESEEEGIRQGYRHEKFGLGKRSKMILNRIKQRKKILKIDAEP